jgi:hypothetical protein
MTSSGTAPQWVTALTGLTGVSSSSITNTSLTSGRVVYSGTGGLQTDSASLTFNGTTLSAGGFSTTGLSTLVQTVKIGDSNFNGVAVFAPATPAKLYMGTGTVTDVTSAISATNTTGAIASLAITPIAASNTGVTYTNASTLYIAGAPSAGTNITITNPYALYVAAGASYLGGNTAVTGTLTATSTASATTFYPTATSGVGIQMTSTGNNNGNWTIANNYGQMTVATEGTAGSLVTGSSQGAALFGNSSNVPAQFFTNNTVRATLDSSGNLGLGVTPTAWTAGGKIFELGFKGNIFYGVTYTAVGFSNNAYYDATAPSGWKFANPTSSRAGYYEQSQGTHAWATSTAAGTAGNAITFTQAMTLDASGNLGIGTTSPKAPLHVVASAGAANDKTLLIQDKTTGNAGEAWLSFKAQESSDDERIKGAIVYANSGSAYGVGNLLFCMNSTADNSNATTANEKMRLNSSGVLQIASTNNTGANAKLVVGTGNAGQDGRAVINTGNTNIVALTLDNWDGTSTSYGPRVVFNNSGRGTFVVGCSDGANNFDICQTWGTPQVRIDTNGNLLVGTTSAVLGGQITCAWDGNVKNGMTLNETGAYTGATFAYFSASGTACGNISRVALTNAVVYNTTSDYRLKTVIGAVSGQGERIDALKPIDYQWKDNGQQVRGFLAHEFQAVYSNSVTGEKDAVDADGNPKYQAMQAATSEVIADLVAEIQSLRKRLAAAGI